MTLPHLRLGVNIDHVATIRNARGGPHPDPLRAAQIAIAAGADGITLHLREDRRHIRDDDLAAFTQELHVPINLELAATQEMRDMALRFPTHAVCIVPEKREERTTEGGLDVIGLHDTLVPYVQTLAQAGRRVSLFIEPDTAHIHAAKALGAQVIELHTGAYADACQAGDRARVAQIVADIRRAATLGAQLGLEVHAGHGLTFDNVTEIAAIPEIIELNIGHFLIGEAIYLGLGDAIATMRALMNAARA